MRLVRLEEADDRARFGGKAVSLGAARRAGLPVPGGFALSVALVDALADGHGDAPLAALRAALGADARLAVRSSAADEDSRAASFAGVHASRLGVRPDGLRDAIAAVRDSGRTAAALAYRARLGLPTEPRLAVVIQPMVRAACAGVLFTRDPVTREDVRVIEACWGLGEAVVSGLVDPDRVVMERGGRVRSHVVQRKDVAIEPTDDGVGAHPVPPERADAPCLTGARLAALEALATACEATFDGPGDLEWAFGDDHDAVVLLQHRPVTR